MRKKVRITVLGLSILLISYFIGQKIVLPIYNQKNGSLTNLVDSNERIDDKDINLIEKFDCLEKYGYQKAEDNPWGETIAKLDGDQSISEGILIVEGAGVGIPVELKTEAELEISTCIHPWMTEYSDGAVLEIRYAEELAADSILLEKYDVKTNETSIVVDLSDFVGTRGTLQIGCTAGKSGDSAGDWLLITKMNLKCADLLLEAKSKETGKKDILRSVHYFADEWPLNFWNSELTNIEQDFQQIMADGFNSIILVIPWREFQPSIDPIVYNDEAFSQLNNIMDVAERNGLSVIVRVGYLWDYYEDSKSECVQRYYDILGDARTRAAWNEYCAKLYEELSGYSNFAGGFITWEDFWKNIYLVDYLDSQEARKEYAKWIGYQEWIGNQFSMRQLEKKYQINLNDYAEIGIPERDHCMLELWYRYIDILLMELLEDSQEYFPDLSMEVRTDWDIYRDKKGENVYYKHNDTFSCADSSYTTIMYAIPQGCINQGEKLHYDEALEKTKYILKYITEENENKPVYVDQFLFADNTPGFEANAQIYTDEINDYLMNIGEILEEYTMGYGIWAYRDYVANIIYNPQFGKESEGWKVDGGEIIEKDGNKKILLSAGDMISQEIPQLRIQYPEKKYTVSMDAMGQKGSMIHITLGTATVDATVPENGRIMAEITTDLPDVFAVDADSEVIIDNIKVYNHIQNGFLYDIEGNEQIALRGIRYLNAGIGN